MNIGKERGEIKELENKKRCVLQKENEIGGGRAEDKAIKKYKMCAFKTMRRRLTDLWSGEFLQHL